MAVAGAGRRARAVRAGTLDPVFLLPLAVAAGLVASSRSLDAGQSEGRVAVDLVVTWSFAAAAVLALARPSLRRSGILMAAIAATWLLPQLQVSSSSAAWTTGMLLQSLWGALLVTLVLTFPDGRPWSRPALLVVAAAWFAAILPPLVALLGDGDPRNAMRTIDSRTFTDLVNRAGSALWVLVVVVLLGLVGARLLRLRGAQRRLAGPFLACTAAAGLLAPVWLAVGAAANESLAARLELVDRGLTLLVPLGFFAGLLWMRLRRSEVSSLVVELQAGGTPSLQERLAAALGDPTLELLYRREGGSWVDGDGQAVELPDGRARAITHVVSGGESVAALVHDPALLDDPDLVESVRATAGLVLENERLAAEVRAQLAEVRASRARLLQAADEERRRLERDLHDGAQQRLVGLALRLRLAQARSGDPAAAAALEQASGELEEALAELREFARGVHPTVLREDGLDAAVEALARRASLPVRLEGAAGERLPDAVELVAYFFVSEALTNVVKHARATHAVVELERGDGVLRVTVADDGVGGIDAAGGTGLRGLTDRLAAVDGTLRVESEPGRGTTLLAELPCGS